MDRSPDGQWCVSGNPDGFAYVWDVQTRKQLCRLDLGLRDGIRCSACCVSISPDRQLAAVGTNQNLIRVCDVRTGVPVATFTGHEDDIQAVTFHPSGNLLASCDKAGVIRVWPLDSDDETDGRDLARTDEWPPSFLGHSARTLFARFFTRRHSTGIGQQGWQCPLLEWTRANDTARPRDGRRNECHDVRLPRKRVADRRRSEHSHLESTD